MSLIKWINNWITEHGSARITRDHVALLKEQKSDMEAKHIIVQATLKQRDSENEGLKTKVSELQILLEDARKEIKTLENVRVSLKNQTQMQARIRQLESMNQEVERQLRMKTLGF